MLKIGLDTESILYKRYLKEKHYKKNAEHFLSISSFHYLQIQWMVYSHFGLKELLQGKYTSHANMSPVYVSLTSGQVSLVFPLINTSPSMPRACNV